MSEENEPTYYETNRETRLMYQRSYYKRNSERIKRKNELDSVLEPDRIIAKREYQREYFAKNRAKILEKRASSKKAASMSICGDSAVNSENVTDQES
jgi:hypothetical protein